MSTAEKELIVASLDPGHPGGTRNRAGWTFAVEPRVALVTPDQKKAIVNDEHIKIHRTLSMGWFSAMGIERTEKNEIKLKKEPLTVPPETAKLATEYGQGAVVEVPKPSTPKKKGKAALKPTVEVVGDITFSSKKEDVVKALEAKGQISGKDFNPDAKRHDLVRIYQSLS